MELYQKFGIAIVIIALIVLYFLPTRAKKEKLAISAFSPPYTPTVNEKFVEFICRTAQEENVPKESEVAALEYFRSNYRCLVDNYVVETKRPLYINDVPGLLQVVVKRYCSK